MSRKVDWELKSVGFNIPTSGAALVMLYCLYNFMRAPEDVSSTTVAAITTILGVATYWILSDIPALMWGFLILFVLILLFTFPILGIIAFMLAVVYFLWRITSSRVY